MAHRAISEVYSSLDVYTTHRHINRLGALLVQLVGGGGGEGGYSTA